jgi:hypothetical protein
MSQNNAAQTGRKLLETAHQASQSGVDVHVRAVGMLPLEVVSIDDIAEDATFAMIRCWSNAKGKSVVWCVPLANILAVEIRDDWPL